MIQKSDFCIYKESNQVLKEISCASTFAVTGKGQDVKTTQLSIEDV